MNAKWLKMVAIGLCLVLSGQAGLGQPAGPEPEEAAAPPVRALAGGLPGEVPGAGALTVAVLDFEVKDPANPQMGSQIADALTAMVAGEPGLNLVERAQLSRTLQEQELSLTGLVDAGQGAQVGKLVGAQLLVTGKAFRLGERHFLTLKIISSETSRVDGMLLKSDPETTIDELVLELGLQLPQRLRQAGPKLVAQPPAPDPLPHLRAQLTQRQLPAVVVVITEEHHGERPRQPLDPAVETEIKQMLRVCGFRVQDVPQNELAQWAPSDSPDSWPRRLAAADVVVTGEAFSEYATRIGNLVSCGARAEINLIDRRTGEVLLAGRQTTRGVDLAEQIAGKKALQKAGRNLGLEILRHFAATLPVKAAGQ